MSKRRRLEKYFLEFACNAITAWDCSAVEWQDQDHEQCLERAYNKVSIYNGHFRFAQ